MVQELDNISPTPEAEEWNNIHLLEFETAIRKWKRNKTPGMSCITDDVIMAGNESLAEEL